MSSWGLLSGLLPKVLVVAALVAGGALVWRRGPRRWWTTVLPVTLTCAALSAIAITWFVDHVLRLFPDPLPLTVTTMIAIALAALVLAAIELVRAGWGRRVIAAGAAAVIVVAASNGINQYYGYFPTLGSVVGAGPGNQISLPTMQLSPTAPPGDVLVPGPAPARGRGLTGWRPTNPVPAAGAVSEVTIPGTISGFQARPGWVYLPPAYLTRPRPDLPILVLISGEPGRPRDWLIAGKAAATMDAFAASHRGLAPIVVMPDALGSTAAKQMCVDSRLGRVDTYLTRDLPNWIFGHLQVDRNTAHWAIGGFSYGGTCAFTLAVAHPELYPTFLDISGQRAPTLGAEAYTAQIAFGGDQTAYDAVQPLHILASRGHDPAELRRFQQLDGTFVVGNADARYSADRAIVVAQCRATGVAVHEFQTPGSHSWYVAVDALQRALEHLTRRMGLR